MHPQRGPMHKSPPQIRPWTEVFAVTVNNTQNIAHRQCDVLSKDRARKREIAAAVSLLLLLH